MEEKRLRMHERRFAGGLDMLRAPERVGLLEVGRVVNLCLQYGQINSVLDIGTGTALFAEEFSRRGLRIAGVDVNIAALQIARSFAPSGDFREGSAEALPFTDHSYDLVFLGLVLHEADDILATLKEAYRVTSRHVCILEWPFIEQPFGPPLAHRLNPEDLVDLFHKAGFRKWKIKDLTNTILYRLEI
jgi:ubiquinone/menaquinone biosynthesis C-methylase UbiE